MLRSTTSGSGDNPTDADASVLVDLRNQISSLSADVAQISADRMEAARHAVEAGTDYAGEKVHEYPLASLAVAFGAGTLIALAILPKRRGTSHGRFASLSSVRDELADYTAEMKRSIRNTAAGRGMLSNFERVADSVSSVDAKATIGPAWNRILSWLDAAANRAASAAADIKGPN